MEPCLYFVESDGTQHQVDVVQGSDTALTFCVNDILKLSNAESTYSHSIELAGTDKTNKVLKQLLRLDTFTSKELKKSEFKVRLEIKGVDILSGEGSLRITNINHNLKTGSTTYVCDITGTNYLWVADLDGKTWCDFPLGSHTLTSALVDNSQDRTGKLGVVYDYSYIGCAYVPVNYGAWLLGDRVSINDLRPSVYVKYLLETIFGSLGYTIAGTITDSEHFEKMILPFTRGIFGVSDDELKTLETTIEPSGHYSTDPDAQLGTSLYSAYDPDKPYWSSYQWRQPYAAFVRCSLSVNEGNLVASLICGNPVGYSGNLNIGLMVNGATIVSQLYDGTEFYLEHDICLAKGDEVRWIVIKISTDEEICITEGQAEIKFTPISGACIGSTVNICDVLDTDYDPLSMVRYLIGCGFYCYTNQLTRTIYFDYISDYYGSKEVEDYQGKLLDCGTEFEEERQFECRNINLNYSDDSADVTLTECVEEDIYIHKIREGVSSCIREIKSSGFSSTSVANLSANSGQIYSSAPSVGYDPQAANPLNYYLALTVGSTSPHWSVNTWTQPKTGKIRVQLHIDATCEIHPHYWAIQVNGFTVFQTRSNLSSYPIDIDIDWEGCLQEGDILRFRILEDPAYGPPTSGDSSGIDSLEAWMIITPASDTFYETGVSPFLAVFPTMRKKTPTVDIDKFDFDKMKKDYLSYDFEPRILYYEGLVDATDIGWTAAGGVQWKYNDGTSDITKTLLPYAYFVDAYQGTRRSLAMSDITIRTVSPDGITGAEVTCEGLHSLEYHILTSLILNDGVYNAWVRMTPKDVANINFGKRKFIGRLSIGSGLFILNRLKDWNPKTHIGKAEFLLVTE